LAEGDARLGIPAELHQEGAFNSIKVKVARQLLGQRLDHRKRRGRPLDLAGSDGPVRVTTGDGCSRSSVS
jgi:hypothetical protein